MPRQAWPSDLTPRSFWTEDQLELRKADLRRYVGRLLRHRPEGLGRPIAAAAETNLMEQEPDPASFEGNRLAFAIKPYEIKTFLVKLT